MYYLRNEDHVSVMWLAVPLSNVFAATAYTAVYPSSKDITGSAAQVWMGFAVLLFVALYPAALQRAIMGHNQVCDGRIPYGFIDLNNDRSLLFTDTTERRMNLHRICGVCLMHRSLELNV